MFSLDFNEIEVVITSDGKIILHQYSQTDKIMNCVQIPEVQVLPIVEVITKLQQKRKNVLAEIKGQNE